MKLWIARDKSGSLCLYFCEPKRIEERGFFVPTCNKPYIEYIPVDKREFPEVSWENSPQQVEINLIKNA